MTSQSYFTTLLFIGWTQGPEATPAVAKAGMYIHGASYLCPLTSLCILNQALTLFIVPPKLIKLLVEGF